MTAPTLAQVRQHYAELSETVGGPKIVSGNLAWFDAATVDPRVEAIKNLSIPEFLRSQAAVSTRPGQYDAMNRLAERLEEVLDQR